MMQGQKHTSALKRLVLIGALALALATGAVSAPAPEIDAAGPFTLAAPAEVAGPDAAAKACPKLFLA